MINKKIVNILFFFFCAVILAVSLRGIHGNPTLAELHTETWKEKGPLELSPERGRYALLYSLAEDHSFAFSPDIARFAAPDVAYANGKYISLFAPAVSFIAIPGYLIGKVFGSAQVGAFSIIALFALLNVSLIRSIAVRLGAHPLAGSIAGLTFLFATPAFAYAVTLYQHHISTFLILLGIYLLLRYNNVFSLSLIWMLCAFSISVDYPNFFMMLPIGVAALFRTFIWKKLEGKISLTIPFMRVIAMFSVIVPLLFFFWFNTMSNGSPLQLSGTIDRAIEVKKDNSPLLESQLVKERMEKEHKEQPAFQKSMLGLFSSRLLLDDFYTHFFSSDRGIIVYTPVMVLGFVGFIYAIKKRGKYIALLTGVLGFNILLYSMWADPYGGWAFGSRYLIPSYAILAIFIALLLTRFGKYNVFLLLFFTLFSYSTVVNTLGAVTSNRIPPKVEAAELQKLSHVHEETTYLRNIDLLNMNVSKSYFFETYAVKYISAWNYYIFITGFIILATGGFIVAYKGARMKRSVQEPLRPNNLAALYGNGTAAFPQIANYDVGKGGNYGV